MKPICVKIALNTNKPRKARKAQLKLSDVRSTWSH